MRDSIRSAVTLALAAFTAACAGSPPPAAIAPLRADSAATLVVRPGDVIKVEVFGHEELSGDYLIDENANLLLPLIGELNVRDMTVPDLRARIRAGYNLLFTQAFITVTPLFRVAVLGEVVRPGLYNVDPTLTVYDLLALAGGPLRAANQNRTRLLRGGQQIALGIDPASLAQATLRELGIRSGDQIIVPRKSITREDWLIILQLATLAVGIITLTR
jgi:polysaccharide export outer membrane protein